MHLNKQFLWGVSFKQMDDFPGVYFVRRPGRVNSSYIISTYKRLKRQKAKKEFFEFLAEFGQDETRANWELHHIVEKQHLKAFFTAPALENHYKNIWPTVLIFGSEEHYAYNQVLHSKETKIIYSLDSPVRTANEKRALHKNIRELYWNTYLGNPVLQTIASNVMKGIRI